MTPEEAYRWLEDAIAASDSATSLTAPIKKAHHCPDSCWGSEARISRTEGGDIGFSGIEIPQWTRSLATVRQITFTSELGKRFLILNLDGWKVVVPKERSFTQGEHVLFLEPDAFLLRGDANRDHLFAQIGPLTEFDGQIGYRVGTSEWYDNRKMPQWFVGHPEREGVEEIISEGYVFHLSDFPEIDDKVRSLDYELCKETMEVFSKRLRNLDFSDELGIIKWDGFPENRPALEERVEISNWTTGPMSRVATSHPKPPSFIPKTDMKRLQECPNLFLKPKYKRQIYQQTTKMDGTTISVYFLKGDAFYFTPVGTVPWLPKPDGVHSPTAQHFMQSAMQPNGRFGVCSRNRDILPHLLPCATAPQYTTYWNAAVAAGLPDVLRRADCSLVVQGELVGATIQGNPYGYPATDDGDGSGRPAHEMLVFSVSEVFFDRNDRPRTQRWDPRRVQAFAEENGLKHVPVLGYATVPKVARCHDDLRRVADESGGEGLVFKNCEDGRWFKVLSTKWLMEKGDEMRARNQLEAINKRRGEGEAVEENEPEPEAEEPEPELEEMEVEVEKPEIEQVEVEQKMDKGKEMALAEPEPKPQEIKERRRMRIGDWEPDSEDEAKIIRVFQRLEEWARNMTDEECEKLMAMGKLERVSPRGNVANRGSDHGTTGEELDPVETLSLEGYSNTGEELVPDLPVEVDDAVVDSAGAEGEKLPGALWGGANGVVDWLGEEGWGLDDTETAD